MVDPTEERRGHFNFFFSEGEMPESFVQIIDMAIAKDFQVQTLTDKDRQTDAYRTIKEILHTGRIEIMYERKVISALAPVIPLEQYLFGFPPGPGLCFLTRHPWHKKYLCDDVSMESSAGAFPLNLLRFILVDANNQALWAYVPPNPESEETHGSFARFWRQHLFENDLGKK